MKLKIDQWQPIEVKLNIKCRSRFNLANMIRENKIPCTIKDFEVLKPKLYKVSLLIAPHNIEKFIKKIKKLLKD